jgi:hyperosmotically inducible protein
MTRRIRTLVFAITVGLVAPVMAATATAELRSTEVLAKQVRKELVTLPFLSVFDNLAYSVDGTTVTLYGQVTRPTLKSGAEKVVQRLEGVDQVVNNIEVLPLSPFDDRIRIAVLRAVYRQPALQRYGLGARPSIQIVVKNGNVTLEGVVTNQADKNIAGLMANGVSGVFSVTNKLRVVRG